MLQPNIPIRTAQIVPLKAKLNLFQRLVRQWEHLHPYNGVQALCVGGRVDLADCRRAWEQTLESLGLGRICLSGDLYHYACLNGEAERHSVQLAPEGTSIDQWITGELNRPFEGETVPFRPILIHENGQSWIGLAYQHWVADSASIRRLMHDWFARLFDPRAVRPRRLRPTGPVTSNSSARITPPGAAAARCWPISAGIASSDVSSASRTPKSSRR